MHNLQVVYYKCVRFHKNPISGFGGVALTRYMDGRTDRLIPIYPSNFVCGGVGYNLREIIKLQWQGLKRRNVTFFIYTITSLYSNYLLHINKVQTIVLNTGEQPKQHTIVKATQRKLITIAMLTLLCGNPLNREQCITPNFYINK
jgi:hypothetical protein